MKNGFRKENIYSFGVSIYLKKHKCVWRQTSNGLNLFLRYAPDMWISSKESVNAIGTAKWCSEESVK